MKTLENTSDRPFKFNAHGNTVVFGTKRQKYVLSTYAKTESQIDEEPSGADGSFSTATNVAKRIPRELLHEKRLIPFDPRVHNKDEAHGHLVEVDDGTAKSILSDTHQTKIHKGKIRLAHITDEALESRARELAEEMLRDGRVKAPAAPGRFEEPATSSAHVPTDPPATAAPDPILTKMGTVNAEMKAKKNTSKGE